MQITHPLVVIGLAAIAAAVLSPANASAAEPEPAACGALHDTYDDASKRLAMNQAESVGERSAVMATTRETENNTILAEARLTLDLMRDNGCTMPTSPPSFEPYFLSALRCTNDMLRVRISGTYSFPPSCKRSDWEPATSPE